MSSPRSSFQASPMLASSRTTTGDPVMISSMVAGPVEPGRRAARARCRRERADFLRGLRFVGRTCRFVIFFVLMLLGGCNDGAAAPTSYVDSRCQVRQETMSGVLRDVGGVSAAGTPTMIG